MFFTGGSDATMNVPGGFTTSFSFYYTAINDPGTITIWSGLDGTGTALLTIPLPVTPSQVFSDPACTDPAEPFCPFFPLGATFSGTAMSVDFSGAEDQVAFDAITLGTPEPASFSLIGLGTALLLAAFRRHLPTARQARH